jgi:AraC-like DNA-binding protein
MPGTYYGMLVRGFGADAATPRRSAAEAPQLVSVRQQLQQVEAVNRRESAGWGLRMGSTFDALAHGAVGMAALTAATVVDAMFVLARYGHLRTPFFGYAARRDHLGVRWDIVDRWGIEDDLRTPLVESTLVSVTGLVERLVGETPTGLTVEVDYPEPDHAQAYRQHLPVPPAFGRARSGLHVPVRWAARRPASADPQLHAALTRLLRATPEPDLEQHALLATVAQLLDATSGRLPIAHAAGRLHITPRTLERRLRRLGTTYRELVDRHRRDEAEHLLVTTQLPITMIAERLGYSDTANFGRTCRRWFGTGPREHRRRATASQDRDAPADLHTGPPGGGQR